MQVLLHHRMQSFFLMLATLHNRGQSSFQMRQLTLVLTVRKEIAACHAQGSSRRSNGPMRSLLCSSRWKERQTCTAAACNANNILAWQKEESTKRLFPDNPLGLGDTIFQLVEEVQWSSQHLGSFVDKLNDTFRVSARDVQEGKSD